MPPIATYFQFLDALAAAQKAGAIQIGGGIWLPVTTLVDASGTPIDATTPLQVGTGATDDAAAAGQIFPAAGKYQATPDEVDNNDVGYLRMTQRRVLLTGPANRIISMTSGAPVPAGSDVVALGGAALAAGDFLIRDAAVHTYMIPMLDWRRCSIRIFTSPAFDQNLSVSLRGAYSNASQISTLLSFTINAGSSLALGIGEGAVGEGGTAGAAVAASDAWYGCAAMNSQAWLRLRIVAAGIPAAGELGLSVIRST